MSHDHAVDAVRYALKAMRIQMSLKQAVISYLYLKDKPLAVKFHRGYASYNQREDKGYQEFEKAVIVLGKHPIVYWLVRIL